MSTVERYVSKFQRRKEWKGLAEEQVFLYALEFANSVQFCDSTARKLPQYWHHHASLDWVPKRFLFAFCYINGLLDREADEDPSKSEMIARIQRNNGRVRIIFLSDPFTLSDLCSQVSPGSCRRDAIFDADTGKIVSLLSNFTFPIDLTHRYFSLPADPFWDDNFLPHTQWLHSPTFRHLEGTVMAVVCTVVDDCPSSSLSSSSFSCASSSSTPSSPSSSFTSSPSSSPSSSISKSQHRHLFSSPSPFVGHSKKEAKKVYSAMSCSHGSEVALDCLRRQCRSLDFDSPDVRVGFIRVRPADMAFFKKAIPARYGFNLDPELYEV